MTTKGTRPPGRTKTDRTPRPHRTRSRTYRAGNDVGHHDGRSGSEQLHCVPSRPVGVTVYRRPKLDPKWPLGHERSSPAGGALTCCAMAILENGSMRLSGCLQSAVAPRWPSGRFPGVPSGSARNSHASCRHTVGGYHAGDGMKRETPPKPTAKCEQPGFVSPRPAM